MAAGSVFIEKVHELRDKLDKAIQAKMSCDPEPFLREFYRDIRALEDSGPRQRPAAALLEDELQEMQKILQKKYKKYNWADFKQKELRYVLAPYEVHMRALRDKALKRPENAVQTLTIQIQTQYSKILQPSGAAAPEAVLPVAITAILGASTEEQLRNVLENLMKIKDTVVVRAAVAPLTAADELAPPARKLQFTQAYVQRAESYQLVSHLGMSHNLPSATGFADFEAMYGRVETLYSQYKTLLSTAATAAPLTAFFETIKNFSLDQLSKAERNVTALCAFAEAMKPMPLAAHFIAYFGDELHGENRRQALGTAEGFKDFLKSHIEQLYRKMAAMLHSGVNPIHEVVAGNWYHNKASDRDMQLSQLWDEVIRYSTGRTADAERQRVLSMGAAEALNRLAADPSADVPENFASLLRGVITSLDAKSAGAGAMDKAEAVKGIVIDREGEAVADDHPELRARLNALSEADLHNVSRNLRRVQQDLLEENVSQPFRQAFTRAYLALPTSIEKLTRVNGYERYKVRESKAWEQYRAYYTLLGQPEPRDVTSPFFTPLSQLETGSLLEQDGTLRQLEENLRQFTAFCQKETTPEDQRQFVREYLQTETAIAHLASKSSFAHFQAALRVRPSAPPKSAMRNEPAAAAVFAPSAPMAASAPPLPVANEIPPLQASLAAKGSRGDQINAAQGAFLMADALNMPIAPSGGLSAASAPPLPTELKKEAVKELVLG